MVDGLLFGPDRGDCGQVDSRRILGLLLGPGSPHSPANCGEVALALSWPTRRVDLGQETRLRCSRWWLGHRLRRRRPPKNRWGSRCAGTTLVGRLLAAVVHGAPRMGPVPRSPPTAATRREAERAKVQAEAHSDSLLPTLAFPQGSALADYPASPIELVNRVPGRYPEWATGWSHGRIVGTSNYPAVGVAPAIRAHETETSTLLDFCLIAKALGQLRREGLLGWRYGCPWPSFSPRWWPPKSAPLGADIQFLISVDRPPL